MAPIWHNDVCNVNTDNIVQIADCYEQENDEAVERPLVPQAYAVVYPRAMMVQTLHTAPALLAMMRSHLTAGAANHADLLEIALFNKREVLTTSVMQQSLHTCTADAVSCHTLTLPQRQSSTFELLLLSSWSHSICCTHVSGVHQRLQLSAARACSCIGRDATARAIVEALPGLRYQLPLVVELVLLQLQPREVAGAAPLVAHQLFGQVVVVNHL
mmetsp:Transcript_48326/g.85066  ORF Transcript_48326/g.85066 Transcript_48326/m.85066 type:complete len:215 (+) Transcript_48326:674-1318(+)